MVSKKSQYTKLCEVRVGEQVDVGEQVEPSDFFSHCLPKFYHLDFLQYRPPLGSVFSQTIEQAIEIPSIQLFKLICTKFRISGPSLHINNLTQSTRIFLSL